MDLSDVWLSRYVKFDKHEHETLTQCDTDMNAWTQKAGVATS